MFIKKLLQNWYALKIKQLYMKAQKTNFVTNPLIRTTFIANNTFWRSS